MPKENVAHILEWVTVAGNRYEIPVKLNAQMETEVFHIDPKLGTGHLELDSEALGPDYDPDVDTPIVVNIRMLLAAADALPGAPPMPPTE